VWPWMVPAIRADATTPLPIVEPFGHLVAQRCPAGEANHRRCRRAQQGTAGVEISGSGTLAERRRLQPPGIIWYHCFGCNHGICRRK
jgi:hypothetical protein